MVSRGDNCPHITHHQCVVRESMIVSCRRISVGKCKCQLECNFWIHWTNDKLQLYGILMNNLVKQKFFRGKTHTTILTSQTRSSQQVSPLAELFCFCQKTTFEPQAEVLYSFKGNPLQNLLWHNTIQYLSFCLKSLILVFLFGGFRSLWGWIRCKAHQESYPPWN